MIIYKIENLINGKKYIGQTIHTLEHRWKGHISDINRFDYALQRSMRKYGIENFNIIEIDTCNKQHDLNKQECFWIDYYNSKVPNGYNIREGGSNGKLSEETKQKISKSRKGQHIGRVAWNKGIPHTEETKKKISKSNTGRNVGVKLSEEHKQKLSDNRKKSKVMIDNICFTSMAKAAKYLNISKPLVFYRINSKSKRFKNYNYIHNKSK